MSHVSKKKVDPRVLADIHDAFLSIVSAGSVNERKKLLSALLTETELTMLAKRLAMIRMLSEEVPHRRIAKKLKVSISTVQRFYQLTGGGDYMPIMEQVIKRKRSEAFWNTFEIALRGGMPARTGRGRWKFLDELVP